MATYTATNLPVKPLEVGDKVVFNLPDETLEYTVKKNPNGCWLGYGEGPNNYVFDRLGLYARGYCRKAYGYTPPGAGNWPFANDLGALTRCVFALWGHIATMPAKKRPTVGDWVKVVRENDYFNVGTVCEIIVDDRSGVPYRLRPHDGGQSWWLRADKVEPCEKPRPSVTLKANSGGVSDAVVTLEQGGEEVNIIIVHNGIRSIVGWFRVHYDKINLKVDMCPNRWLEPLCRDDDGGMKVYRWDC